MPNWLNLVFIMPRSGALMIERWMFADDRFATLNALRLLKNQIVGVSIYLIYLSIYLPTSRGARGQIKNNIKVKTYANYAF
jgi:hypothetical protein